MSKKQQKLIFNVGNDLSRSVYFGLPCDRIIIS